MIRVFCDSCLKELNEPGGLLFSPPDEDGNTEKQHLCCDCYRIVVNFMTETDPLSDGE